MPNDPRDVVNRLAQAVLTNDPEKCAAIYSEDCVIIDPQFDIVGRSGAVDAFKYVFNAFRFDSLEVVETIVEGSRIAVHWKWTGFHKGEYLGIPATNKDFSTWNAIFFDTADGYITRDLSIWDTTQFQKLQALAGSVQTGN
jgi:steroid delta-isomerase-like uncharacterized protein